MGHFRLLSERVIISRVFRVMVFKRGKKNPLFLIPESVEESSFVILEVKKLYRFGLLNLVAVNECFFSPVWGSFIWDI